MNPAKWLVSQKSAALFLALIITLSASSCAEKVATAIDDEDENETQEPGERGLVYFWMFDGDLANNTELTTIDATYPSNAQAFISYESSLPGYPNTDRRASLERRNRPTSINYRSFANNNIPFEDSNMRAVQVRQPFRGDNGENTMIINVPAQGLTNLLLEMAAMDEGTGTEALLIDYSINSGSPQWINEGLESSRSRLPLDSEYALLAVDFGGIEGISDNADFKIRIRFDIPNGSDETGDRVTFNNISVEASEIP